MACLELCPCDQETCVSCVNVSGKSVSMWFVLECTNLSAYVLSFAMCYCVRNLCQAILFALECDNLSRKLVITYIIYFGIY